MQLSVSDARSWVSVSESDLGGGVTLSPDNKSAETTVSTKNPVTITLGVVKGVALTVDNQTVDLSKLTAQTGKITVTFTKIKEKRMEKNNSKYLNNRSNSLYTYFYLYLTVGNSIESHMVAAIIFAIASITDYLDGYLARKWNVVSKILVNLQIYGG